MRIGLDARFLTHPQRGGFKTYTRTVVSALVEADSAHEFVLYTDRSSDDLPDVPGNFMLKAVPGANAVAREQMALPIVMSRDAIDVAHFPCNTGPVNLGPKLVMTVHDAIPFRKGGRISGGRQRFLNAYWRTVIPRAARAAEMVVVSSQYVGEDIRERFGIAAQKLCVVPIAVNPIYFDNLPGTPPAGVDPGSPFVLAFGSADGRKNHQSAIQAFDSIAPRFPGVKLVLVCSHASVRETLLPSQTVIPVGPVSSDELLWLYRNALALVFPSFDEGFGLPPLEAMACGTPVVASNAGSVPEVVAGHGIVVDPSDVSGIARGLSSVMGDRDLQRRLAAEGRAHASQFNLRRMGAELITVYEAAAGLGKTKP